MSSPLHRREFIKRSGLLAAGLSAWQSASLLRGADSPGEKIVLAVMGTNGRGLDLIAGFTAIPGVEIAYICDVDTRAIAKGITATNRKQAKEPKGLGDFRRALDDKEVDALVIAAPDHWHGPATIMACAAGKHVYVEKPACHNPHEGELMIAAARKHRRVVQLGTQRRSMPGIIEAIDKLQAGAIGPVRYARAWYNNARGTIGRGQVVPVPSWLEYSLWQGPAPERPYHDNVIHYNWHWFWHWGTGELGNNGIHALDVCRWGLGVEFPHRVTSGGGRYHFQDDWETPDTQVVTYDFGDKGLVWEGHSCDPYDAEHTGFGASFYGDGGAMVVGSSGYRILDGKGKEVSQGSGPGSDSPHQRNFLDCIRSGKSPNAEIEVGFKSTLLCHLGNIAQRTGRTVSLDPDTHRITGDLNAAALWRREYRPGWEPRF